MVAPHVVTVRRHARRPCRVRLARAGGAVEGGHDLHRDRRHGAERGWGCGRGRFHHPPGGGDPRLSADPAGSGARQRCRSDPVERPQPGTVVRAVHRQSGRHSFRHDQRGHRAHRHRRGGIRGQIQSPCLDRAGSGFGLCGQYPRCAGATRPGQCRRLCRQRRGLQGADHRHHRAFARTDRRDSRRRNAGWSPAKARSPIWPGISGCANCICGR